MATPSNKALEATLVNVAKNVQAAWVSRVVLFVQASWRAPQFHRSVQPFPDSPSAHLHESFFPDGFRHARTGGWLVHRLHKTIRRHRNGLGPRHTLWRSMLGAGPGKGAGRERLGAVCSIHSTLR